MSILVSGSLTYDHIMNFPDSFRNHILPEQIHILNVGFTVDRLETSRGGTASNIAFTMKLLGADPIIVSAIGKDGTEYLKYLDELGLSIKYILKDDKKLTASAHITTDVDDNQITAFYNGALDLAEELSPRSISEEVELALISPMPRAVMIKHLKECFELGLETVFDPGQQITVFNEQNLKTMISQAHFVIGNDYEIKLLERRAGWDARGMVELFEILQREGRRNPSSVEVFFSSHPPPQDRISRLRAEAGGGGGTRDTPRFQAIKARLQRMSPPRAMPRQ